MPGPITRTEISDIEDKEMEFHLISWKDMVQNKNGTIKLLGSHI